MPKKRSKVRRCVTKVVKSGKSKGVAIAICPSSTGLRYNTGRKLKK